MPGEASAHAPYRSARGNPEGWARPFATALAFATAGVVGACLPSDNRPVPASILVTVEPSEATKNGFTSIDGWQITFDRVLVALGDVDLDDADETATACNAYSETHYERLFDLVAVDQEKVGLVYGIGQCSVEYRLRGPDDETLLGPGVTSADLADMSERGSDPYDGDRTTFRVIGSLSRDGVTKQFDWRFRRGFEFSNCVRQDGAAQTQLSLESEEAHTLRVEMRAEELFRLWPNDEAPLQVGPMGEADDDGDGFLTLAELESSNLPALDLPIEGLAEDELPDPLPPTRTGLMYELLLPRVTRIVGGAACEAEVRGRR